MKKLISTFSLITGMIFLMAFNKPVKEETYTVDTEQSTIEWIGRKVTGQHAGTIKLAAGELIFNGNSLQKGNFLMSMASIVCADNAKVTAHLKTEDFFSAEKNPTSKFEITKVTSAGADRVNVSGNLTIKGITQPLTFPATVKKQGDVVVAVAQGIKVDRIKYDIKFRSKSFFGDIGDRAIDNEFELAINLVAKKNEQGLKEQRTKTKE